MTPPYSVFPFNATFGKQKGDRHGKVEDPKLSANVDKAKLFHGCMFDIFLYSVKNVNHGLNFASKSIFFILTHQSGVGASSCMYARELRVQLKETLRVRLQWFTCDLWQRQFMILEMLWPTIELQRTDHHAHLAIMLWGEQFFYQISGVIIIFFLISLIWSF